MDILYVKIVNDLLRCTHTWVGEDEDGLLVQYRLFNKKYVRSDGILREYIEKYLSNVYGIHSKYEIEDIMESYDRRLTDKMLRKVHES